MSKKIWVWDLETLDLFTATFVDRDSDDTRVFVYSNTKNEMPEMFEFLSTEVDGLIGYNSLNFDAQVLEYMYRYPNCTPQDIRNYAMIITSNNDRQVDVPEWKLRHKHLDLYRVNHFDNKNRRTGLKWCEFGLDMDNIEDMPSQGQGENWEQMVLSYNLNDVLATKALLKYTEPLLSVRRALKPLYNIDVASLYPSIAIVNGLYPQHLGPEFKDIYKKEIVDVRLAEKAKKDKGNKAIVEGFKEAANATYGKSNDIYSWLYDPQYTMATTINGQLMLTMLAEDLMELPKSNLIQINTDGLTMRLHKDSVTKYYQICDKWMQITKLQLEYAEYSKMIISDVNNYIGVYTNGKTKTKGKYEFKDIPLHKNKSHSIIPLAVHNYWVNNIPVEKTIKEHTNIFDFCAGVKSKRSDKKGASHYELHWIEQGNYYQKKLSKTVRYYVSKEGKTLIKKYEDNTFAQVEAPVMKGNKLVKEWKVTYFNKAIYPTNFKEYGIDYTYYISKAKEWINDIQQIGQIKLL